MSPFVVFIIILVVIWTLSGIATAVNKQKEQERRRQLRMQMERAAALQRGGPPPPPPLPVRPPPQSPRQISEGIAARFPDVLLPPAIQRPMQQPPPPPRPTGPRGQKVKTRPKKGRQLATVEPIPTSREEDPVTNLVTPAPPLASVRQTASSVQAPAISRWLKPETLRQQFILTEIFQPPLALRNLDNR